MDANELHAERNTELYTNLVVKNSCLVNYRLYFPGYKNMNIHKSF